MSSDKKYDNLISQENEVVSSGNALGYEYKFENKNLPILGDYVKVHSKDTSGFYYNEKYEKTKIVTHFTLGYFKSDLQMLTRPDIHVSTAFLIGATGTIYSLFPSSRWSYHVGSGASGGNTTGSKSSIGIEISNIGCLTKDDNLLRDYYGNVYCTIDDISAYHYVKEGFRGKNYFASFTGKQYNAIKRLYQYLTDKYDIPYKFLDYDKRFSVFTDKEAREYEGICSHINFQNENPSNPKWDIGPAFDWFRVENIK